MLCVTSSKGVSLPSCPSSPMCDMNNRLQGFCRGQVGVRQGAWGPGQVGRTTYCVASGRKQTVAERLPAKESSVATSSLDFLLRNGDELDRPGDRLDLGVTLVARMIRHLLLDQRIERMLADSGQFVIDDLPVRLCRRGQAAVPLESLGHVSTHQPLQ